MTARRRLGALTVLLLTAALLGATPAPAEAATMRGSFRGSAWGTRANSTAGEEVQTALGRSGSMGCPCNGTNGRKYQRKSSVKSPGVVDNADIVTTAVADKFATRAYVRMITRISNLSMFAGQLTAREVKAVARTRANETRFRRNIKGSYITGLEIAGQPVDTSELQPGDEMAVPGIGTAKFFVTRRFGKDPKASIQVRAIVVTAVEGNDAGLPAGSKIYVGHAMSEFRRSQPKARLGGASWASRSQEAAAAGEAKTDRRTARSVVGCRGTKGKVQRKTTHDLGFGDLGGASQAETTAYGGRAPSGNGLLAKTTARVEDLNLLAGAITADEVKAVSRSYRRDSGRVGGGTKGTRFKNLRVAGQPTIDDDVPPNTTFDLPGVGQVTLNERIKRKTDRRVRVEVTMIRVVFAEGNAFGVEAGGVMEVAHADSLIRPFK